MSDTVIRAEGLGKCYRLGMERGRTLRETLASAFSRPAPRDDFWALRDVGFEIRRGELVGIVGRNGAGKSTLLRILARITRPSEGRAEIDGRIGALLEVGTGFHPELSGRDNIFLNGSILGMSRAEIVRKFDDIVAFADVARFIDTPVKRYSSGMYVRLAFAVAAHLEPEILLVDEVLAVGDLAFQKKCLGKMEDIARQGRTVLFVSHNLQAVRALCPRSILIGEGRVRADGPTAGVLRAYFDELAAVEVDARTAAGDPRHRRGSGAIRFTEIQVEGLDGTQRYEFQMGEGIVFRLSYEVFEAVHDLAVSVVLRSGLSREIVTSVLHTVSSGPVAAGGTATVQVVLPAPNLRPGLYPLYFWLGDASARPYDVVDDLTHPLVITTDRGYDELGYDPAYPSGFFSMESRLVAHEGAVSGRRPAAGQGR